MLFRKDSASVTYSCPSGIVNQIVVPWCDDRKDWTSSPFSNTRTFAIWIPGAGAGVADTCRLSLYIGHQRIKTRRSAFEAYQQAVEPFTTCEDDGQPRLF